MEGQLKKKLIKYLLEDKVCNLVTEIFSTERESVPAPNTEVFLRRSIIEPAEPGFSYQPLLLKEENTLRFFVWVIDERQEFANKERFPDAKNVICGEFKTVLPELHINKNDYVAIVTRGHSCDGDCLYYILTHEMPGYLGMIGSKRRVSAQFTMFKGMGISEEKIAQVHNPIGLPIKGVTPPEIAVSILAELILTKRTKKTDGKVQTELDYEVLSEWLSQSRPCAMATILKAQGSSPRKEGAKMLIFEDKSILGSVGGGLAESKVIEKGCEIIGSGKAFLFHFVMDADVAARVGMACGGTFDILIEDVKF